MSELSLKLRGFWGRFLGLGLVWSVVEVPTIFWVAKFGSNGVKFGGTQHRIFKLNLSVEMLKIELILSVEMRLHLKVKKMCL